jgi:hypothetical protein
MDELSGEAALDELPPPPRTMRTLTIAVMALTALLTAAFALSLFGEARYALSPAAAIDVGSFAEAELGDQHAERYVRARVSIADVPVVRFRRALERDGFRVAHVGSGRWVAYRVPDEMDGPRFVAPSLVAGRLVPLSRLGPHYRGLAAALGESSGRAPGQGWLLVDGQRPDSAGWVAGFEALLLLFFGWNVLSLVKVVRRVKPAA